MYIFKFSFNSGVIQDKLKIARISPIFKNGEKDNSQIIGQYLLFHSSQKFLEG